MSEFLKNLDRYQHLRHEIEELVESKYLGQIMIKFDDPPLVIPEGTRFINDFVTTSHLTVVSARLSVSLVHFDPVEIRLKILESRNWCKGYRHGSRSIQAIDNVFDLDCLDMNARIMILSEIKRILES